MLVTGALSWAAAWGAACGGDPAGPPEGREGSPTLELAGSVAETDSVGALRIEPGLELRVRDVLGVGLDGVEVQLRSDGMLMADPERPSGFTELLGVRTDADGTAGVRVRFGTVSGPGAIVVSVPAYGLADTARYTILPGAPAEARLLPRDTLVPVGSSVRYRAEGWDRLGNPVAIPDASLTLTAPRPATVTVDGLTVTAVAPGGGPVVGTTTAGPSPLRDSTELYGAPAGRLAWMRDGRIRVGDFMGNGETISSVPSGNPRWSPDGSSLIYVSTGEGPRLLLLEPGGGTRELLPGLRLVRWPTFSPDGEQVYFTGWLPDEEPFSIYRVWVDGTGVERVLPERVRGHAQATSPDLSPDGSEMVYRARLDQLVIQELAGGARLVVDEPDPWDALGPRWSPDGAWIAYVGEDDALFLIRPDGSGRRRLADGPFAEGLAWSPDGRTIAIQGDGLNLVDVASGVRRTLPGVVVDPGGLDWTR